MVRRLVTLTVLASVGVWPFAGVHGAAAGKPALVVATDGKSAYTIVVPDTPDPRGRVKRASDLLQSVLQEATGAKLPIVKEGEFRTGTPALFLGRTRAAAAARLPLKEIRGWTYLNQAVGNDLFLVGLDDTVGIKGAEHLEYFGTLKAVTAFLENEAGVRFLLPGPNGTHVPHLTALAVPADLRVLKTPTFAYVIGRQPGDLVYALANNYFYTATVLRSYGGHSYYTAVPAATYAKTHPEYFALIGGVRTAVGNHLCISNPEVQQLMIDEMTKALDAGYQWVELAQTDGYQPCDCEKCKAIHPNIGERLWIVHRKLAEKMRTLRPGKKVMIISYGPTIPPPTSFRKFPDNVVIQMCHYEPEAFDAWQPFKVDKTVYLYNWGTYWAMGYGPKRTPRYAVEQVRRLVENQVRGIYLCGAFEDLGLEGPVFYAYGKAMGDPRLEPAALADEFYRLAYGTASAPMKAFFTGMYGRLEFFSGVNRPNFRTGMKDMPAFITPEDAYCHFFPAKLLIDMARNLERAKAGTNDPKVQARLRLVEAEFAYVRNLATIFQLYRAYRLTPDWETFGTLATAIEARHGLIDSWYDAKGAGKAFDGWPRLWGGARKVDVTAGGYLSAVLSAPVNWNTRILREKKVLPGVGAKTATIARAAGIVVDGRLNDAAWATLTPQEFVEIGMGELKNDTTFRLGYDDTNLYLGFDCALNQAEYLKLTPYGQDGACFRSECLEVLLDPFGTREKYYHLIFNPIANSRYDARGGFIDDPLDPRSRSGEPGWNGDWEYAAQIDVPGKRWTAEVRIPFATLGVEAPKPGSAWTGNFGREEYPLGPGASGRDEVMLSLWSPNLEERSFHSTAAFGSLVFE